MSRTLPFDLPLFLLALIATAPSACAQAPAEAAAARKATLRAAGVAAPLTLYPVRVLGRADRNVAEALGLVLEDRGLSDMQVADAAFDAGDAGWDAIPERFAAQVKANAGKDGAGRYGLYAEFLGEPRRGPTEVRFLLVDSAGGTVLVDRQTPADAAFQRTAGRDPDPLGCATLVAERLFELSGWTAVPGGVRDGRFKELWRQKSGAPDQRDRAAQQKRLAALRARVTDVRIAVLPTLWDNGADAASSERLATGLARQLGCRAQAVLAGTRLEVKPSSNEQKRLWDLATALTGALGKQAVDADYAMVADIGLCSDGKGGYVHVVLVNRAGEVVFADFQNDQHPMFQELAPKQLADGERLALARVAHLLH